MTDRAKSRIITGLLCLCCLLAGALLRPSPPPAAAQAAPQARPDVPGRYTISAVHDRLYFADTQTGRIWYYDTGLVLTSNGPAKPAWHSFPTPDAARGQ